MLKATLFRVELATSHIVLVLHVLISELAHLLLVTLLDQPIVCNGTTAYCSNANTNDTNYIVVYVSNSSSDSASREGILVSRQN